MEHPHEPIDAIKKWQDWYKSHRVVASIDNPLVSKDSRENMHDTTNAIETIGKEIWLQKVEEHFADTLAEFQYELSGKDFYEAFCRAAHTNMEVARKEYERAKELVDMLQDSQPGQD
jgi:hypothetical protein